MQDPIRDKSTSHTQRDWSLNGFFGHTRQTPLRITLLYVAFSLIWIWTTDLFTAIREARSFSVFMAASLEETVFVIVSSALMYWLILRSFQTVAETSALLHAVVDGTTDAIFVKDRHGKYLLFNQAASEFVGKPIREVVGHDDTTLFDAESARRLMDRDQQVMASRQTTTEEEQLTANGITRTYLAMKGPYRDQNGEIAGVIGTSRDITELKQASQRLKEQEALARGILDSMPAHIAVLDQQGVITTVNERWRRFSIENFNSISPAPKTGPGSNYLEVLSLSAVAGCEDARLAEQGIRSVITGTTDRFTVEYECHSSSANRWFSMSVTPLGVGMSGVVVTHHNITDRWMAEESLRASERKFRDLADAIPQIVWTAGPDGGLNHLNAKASEYTGLEINELTGWSWERVIHPDDLQTTIEHWSRMLQTGIPQDLEFRILRRDGQYRWHITRQVPARDRSGTITAWYGTCTDVEDLKQVERAVRRSEEMLRLVLDNIPQGVFWKDRESRYLGCNQVVARAMGLENPDAIRGMGNEDSTSITPEQAAFFKQKDQEVMNSNKPQHHIVETITFADGRTVWLDTNKVPLHDDQGQVSGILGTWEDITERRTRDEMLRLSEAKLRIFVEHVSAPIAMLDRDMRYLYVSRRWNADYRLGDRDLTGLRHYDVFPDLPERWKEIHQRCLAGATEQCKEDRFERSDGTIQWLRWEIRPWFTANNEVGGLFMFTEDITEQKRSEQFIRESEERYRRLVDVLPDAIFINCGGRISFCNPACTKLFGAADASEIVGKTPFELFRPEYHESIRKRISLMFESRQPAPPAEHQIVRFDGQSILVHVVATPIEDRGHDAILVCLHDLTERERSMETLRTVMGSVNDAILTINAQGIVQMANPSTERLFGYPPQQVIGRNVSMLMPVPYSQEHDSYISNFIRTGIAKVIGSGREVEGLRRDGSTFPLELTVTEFWLGTERHFTGVIRDITARKRLESQFQQAQKMEAVGRLAGGVAHDFNNLLTIILGYSDLVLEEIPSDAISREWILSIRDAGERASRLTQQLLAFSRKAIVEPKLIDLNELVHESAKLFRRLIGEDILLSVVADPTLACISADPGQIEQVIMNLVVNAKDAMPTGGRLTIETRNFKLEPDQSAFPDLKPGLYVQLTVSDTGSGMTDEVKNKIFEPFFTTKGIGKGTGLGLAVVHGIIKQCEGAVQVESFTGQGTIFKLLFPIAKSLGGETESEFVRMASRGTETILLVEDEDEVRTISRIALETQGFRVLAAANGDAALQIIQEYLDPIHLLVTDVVMPGMGGRQVAEAMRALRPGILVLYMSGYTDDAVVHHGIVDGIDAFIQKPFTPLSLARKARSVLDGAS